MERETPSVQSVQRSFALLEKLVACPNGAAIKDLAAQMHLAKSTVHRLLANLAALGYVSQVAETGHYRATLKLFEVGSQVVGQIDVVSLARPHLNALAAQVGETVHLVVRDGCDAVYVFKADSGAMRMSSRLGSRMPLYNTGVGKAILAALPYGEVEKIWKQSQVVAHTPKTILRWEDLVEELARTRSRGWAVDDEENEPGIRCVAVALPAAAGVGAAFSISGMAAAMDQARMDQLAGLCLQIKAEIVKELGL